MNKLENLIDMARLNDLLGKKEEDNKEGRTLVWVLAVIGAVAAVAGIAQAVYRFMRPDDLDDFEDEFEDDFEDEDSEDEEEDFFVDEGEN